MTIGSRIRSSSGQTQLPKSAKYLHSRRSLWPRGQTCFSQPCPSRPARMCRPWLAQRILPPQPRSIAWCSAWCRNARGRSWTRRSRAITWWGWGANPRPLGHKPRYPKELLEAGESNLGLWICKHCCDKHLRASTMRAWRPAWRCSAATTSSPLSSKRGPAFPRHANGSSLTR